ncbi:MAG: ferredoxin reductase [Moraxellaceae bacterium]|nr:MAG: ferredoxin reductase [Moraxellaceae bacterium]
MSKEMSAMPNSMSVSEHTSGSVLQRLGRFAQSVMDHDAVNFWAGKLNPLWSLNQPMARIVAREEAASNSVTLILKPNRHVVLPQAGQHLNVAAEVEGVRIARSYSSSAVLDQPGLLAITVKQVKGGRLSNWLCLQAREGDVLYLGQPFGDFQWPVSPQPVLLLAAGSGITPMISLLRQYAQHAVMGMPLPSKQAVQLHYWVRSRAEACFVEELQALTSIQPNFTFHLYLTQQDLSPAQASQPYAQYGRIQASHFAQQEDLNNSHVLACGSAGFVSTAQQILHTQVASFQAEAFSLPSTHADSANTDPASNQTVEITLQKQQRILTVPSGQSILEALEAQGISHPSGCRMGLCNTCACHKVSGSTKHMISGEQQHEETAALRVCISQARSDLVLDI